MSVLQDILSHKANEIKQFYSLSQQASHSPHTHTNGLSSKAKALLASLKSPNTSFIFEIKPASPAAGVLQQAPDIPHIVQSYSTYATAISVLTDTRYFGGSFDLLKQCAALTQTPLLCKDFIIDEIQLDLAITSGATAILLIVKALTDNQLDTLYRQAISRGLLPFVEVNSEDDVTRALHIKPDVILINNRNLDTLDMDMNTTKRLSVLIPDGITIISASGFSTAASVQIVRPYASNFLIGSALMQTSPNMLNKVLQDLVSAFQTQQKDQTDAA